MAKKPDWDYALKIKGVSLKSLPLTHLAEYLKDFAGLLGDSAKPVLDGIVKGSIVLRARQTGEHAAYTKIRMQAAANDATLPAAKSLQRIQAQMKKDGAHGEIVDRNSAVVINFARPAADKVPENEVVIHDDGELDGRLISIIGADDTVHIRLQDAGGVEYKITLRDLGMARKLATHFREEILRVYVHGTWKRSGTGVWEPHQLYADRFEVLDDAPVGEVFSQLKAIETGWSKLEDPIKEWESIRGLNDLHA